MSKNEFISYVRSLSVVIISLLFLIFPSFFLTASSDVFIFPKQVFVIFAGIILLVLLLLRMIAEQRITIRSTPFNLPLLLLGIGVLISAVLSRNIYDSLLQAVPFFALVVIFLTIANSIEDKLSLKLIVYALVIGCVLSNLITVLQFFKIYILPFQTTHIATFNTFGAPIQQIMYSIPVLLIAAFHLIGFKKSKVINYDLLIFALASVFILFSTGVLLYQILFSAQKVVMLPYVYGFQIAFASISQDAQRFLLSLLFGSGYGTFSVDFTRFRLPSFNLEKDIWNMTFSYSSSFLLELISTTGVFGMFAFFLLIYKALATKAGKPNVFYLAILLLIAFAILLPLSYTVLFLMVSLLALYCAYLYLEKSHYVENITVTLVALKQGLLSFETTEIAQRPVKTESKVLPIVIAVVIMLAAGFIGYGTVRLLISDIDFRNSLLQASQNNGQKAYELQTQAISTFPYKSDYYRVFSQLNMALASALAGTTAGAAGTQNTQVQQTVLTLIQQSISSARIAVTYSPMTVSGWQNMAQIYRNLINVGQNAEQFTVASLQQAITLDPYNPSLYIDLGGVYFQLGQYDNALNQFQIAARLKPDFANAYYNLGHAYEAKGDLNNALLQYQAVKQLTVDDKTSLAKIDAEIAALQEKVGKPTGEVPQVQQQTTNQPPLQVNQPAQVLPTQKPPVQIPEPPVTVVPTSTPAPSVSPASSVEVTQTP